MSETNSKTTSVLQQKEAIEIITAEQPAEDVTVIGTDTFRAKLLELLNSEKIWRTVQSLAKVLHVDVIALDKWLCLQTDFVRKPSQEDGVYYYAYAPRFNREVQTIEKGRKSPKIGTERLVVSEEHRYALAQLHLIYLNLHKVLKTYAMEIHDIDPEAFSHLNSAFTKLESGLLLFSGKTKATVEKLPKL